MSHAYSDVQPLMETAAMRDEQTLFVVQTWGRAVNIRQRCYRFRSLMQKQAAERLGNIPGFIATTAFDDITISILDTKGKKITQGKPANLEGKFTIVFEKRKTLEGELLDSEGNPIEFAEFNAGSSNVEPDFDEFEISDLGLDLDIEEDK